MVQYMRQIDTVAKLVIATCINRAEMELHGKTYFDRNNNFTIKVFTVSDWFDTVFTCLNVADTAARKEEEERYATELVQS